MSCGMCAILIAFMLPAARAVTVGAATARAGTATARAGTATARAGTATARAGAATRASMHVQMELEMKNPISAILKMLEQLRKANEEKLSVDKTAWEEMECLCKKSLAKQGLIVKSLGEEIPELEKKYKSVLAEIHLVQLTWDEANKDLMEASKSSRELKAIHLKEHGDTVKQIDDYKQNLEAIQKAIDALNKGMGKSFLQTGTSKVLNNIISNADLSDDKRDIVTAFLDQSSREDGQEPGTSEIVGVLKQIQDDMGASLKEIELKYTKENAAYLAQMEALQDQIKILTDKVMTNGSKKAGLMMQMVELKAKLNSLLTGEYITAQKLLAQIQASCEAAEKEWLTKSKTLREEAMAIADAIAILSDDDARELFRKTLPGMGESLLQLQVSQKQLAKEAQAALSVLADRDYRVRAISYLMEGRKLDMTKVLRMIQDLIDLLKREAVDETNKRDYCIASIRSNEHEMDILNTELKPVKSVIEDLENQLDDLNEQIKILQDQITGMNEYEAELTKMRNDENKRYLADKAADTAALHTLNMAKFALTNFYDKHKAAFMQLLSHLRNKQPEDRKIQDASGVISMIRAVISSVELSMAEDEQGEKNALHEYKIALRLLARDRQQKQKVMGEYQEDHAYLDERLQKYKEEKQHLFDEEMRLNKILMGLRADCDFLVNNFVVRKEAREGEIESLKNAKIVLVGALPKKSSGEATDFVQVEQTQDSKPRKLLLSERTSV